jgi:hypothetical protein
MGRPIFSDKTLRVLQMAQVDSPMLDPSAQASWFRGGEQDLYTPTSKYYSHEEKEEQVSTCLACSSPLCLLIHSLNFNRAPLPSRTTTSTNTSSTLAPLLANESSSTASPRPSLLSPSGSFSSCPSRC